MNAPANDELTGRCLCGALRYTLKSGFRLKPYACHCSDCQRRTGSAFSMHMLAMKSDIETSGETDDAHFVQPSGAETSITGCKICRARIYSHNDQRPGFITLRVGTLDNASEKEPAAHLWVNSKQRWVIIPDDVPLLEQQPWSSEEWVKLLGP